MNLARRLSVASFVALILLGLAWELWLAPVRPGGTSLALKVLPLLLGLPGIARGQVRAYQAWSMGILLYLCEGLVRGMSDTGLSASLAVAEVVLSLVAFGAVLAYAWIARKQDRRPAH